MTVAALQGPDEYSVRLAESIRLNDFELAGEITLQIVDHLRQDPDDPSDLAEAWDLIGRTSVLAIEGGRPGGT